MDGYQVEIATELNGNGIVTKHDFMRDGSRIDLFTSGTRAEIKSVRVTLSSPSVPSQWDRRHRTATSFRLELTSRDTTKSVSFGIMPYDCDLAPDAQVSSPAFDCVRKFFSTYNVSSTASSSFQRQGCGWTDLRPFQTMSSDGSDKWNAKPSYLYTDSMGWMLTTDTSFNATASPAAGVVFASSWGDPLSSIGGSVDVDFADGIAFAASSEEEYNAVWSFRAAFVNCEI
jgi:hypothetical protein